MFLHQLDWQRSNQPVLSAMTTGQDWCRVQIYNPTVIRVGDQGHLYGAGDGTIKVDGSGIYRHIGVAVCVKGSAFRG